MTKEDKELMEKYPFFFAKISDTPMGALLHVMYQGKAPAGWKTKRKHGKIISLRPQKV